MSDEVAVVRRLFAAVEDRDLQSMLACYADDVEIHEAEVCPMAGPGVDAKVRWLTRRDSSERGEPCRVPTKFPLIHSFGVMGPAGCASCSGTGP